MLSTGKLYKVKNTAVLYSPEPLFVKINGVGASIDILASHELPIALSDMRSLCPEDAPLSDGYHTLAMLDTYIAFNGTADSIECPRAKAELIGEIS